MSEKGKKNLYYIVKLVCHDSYIDLNCNHFSLALVGAFAKIKVVLTCYNKSRALKMRYMPHSENTHNFFFNQNVFFLLFSNLQ